MSEVAAIRRLSDADQPVAESSESGQPAIPIVDLRSLFFATAQDDIEHAAYVIVISIPGFACAALVDGIKPGQRAEMADQLAMPALLSGERYPFSGAIRVPEGLVLVIDSHCMAEVLRREKPEVSMEETHGS
jgi:chemotaxis signal transduction protein